MYFFCTSFYAQQLFDKVIQMTRDNLSLWSIQIPKKFMHINFADLNISVLQNTSVRLTYIIMSLVLSAFKYSLLTTGQSNGDIIMLNRPQNELFPHQQLIIEFMHTSNIINVKNLMHKWYLWSSIKIILYHLFISERRGVREWTRGNPFPSPSPPLLSSIFTSVTSEQVSATIIDFHVLQTWINEMANNITNEMVSNAFQKFG